MSDPDATLRVPTPDPAELLGRALESQPATGHPQDWEPPSPETLQVQLQGYVVSHFLARGGMGAVYRGMHVSLDRQVAIKILPPQLRHGDPQYAARFQQEARAMAKLNHPGIVGVYDFGQMADDTLYFIMEFVDGTDVGQMVMKQGRLSSVHAMSITAHVCDALQYAHERDIVHRDIKPANIMVGYDGRVKVADFGLAKSVRQMDTGLTQSGYVMGTPHFVAPEALILGMEVDQRADIYAVGVMLYQMLTGKVPQGMFEMPSMQVAGLDPRYDQIIARAMREDRDQRYPTIQEMRRALDGILTQPVPKSETGEQTLRNPPPPPPPAAPPPRPTPASAARRKSKVPVIFAVLASCIALAGWWLQKDLRISVETPPDPVAPPVVAVTTPAPVQAPVPQMPAPTAEPVVSPPPQVTAPQPLAAAKIFLGDLKPQSAQVAWSSYKVNAHDDNDARNGWAPLIDGKICTQYLFANASSRLDFAIPEGFAFFTAVGFGPTDTRTHLTNGPGMKSWKYLVQVDGRTVFESDALNTYQNGELPMEVPLPPGARTLVLHIDSMGDANADRSMWGYPTLHRSSQTLPPKVALRRALTDTQKRLVELEEQARKAWDRNSAQVVEAEMAALGKSYLANGFPRALAEAARRNDPAEQAALQKERDAFITDAVVRSGDEAGIHPSVQKLRVTYHEARQKIQAMQRPMPPSLYEPYFTELRKLISNSGSDHKAVMKRYEELFQQSGFHTSATPAMSPEFKRRCGGLERLSWIQKAGGSRETEQAVSRGIEFLKSKQNPDGSWGTELLCMNTSLALLAFYGHCETPDSPLYGDTVMKGLLYLVETSRKSREGFISANLASSDAAVEHGMAVYALAEAYSAARAGARMLPGLQEAVERGTQAILSHQLPKGGWDSQAGSGFSSSGEGNLYVTVWQCLALDQVVKTGLKVNNYDWVKNRLTISIYNECRSSGGFGIAGGSPRMDPLKITGPATHAASVISPRDRRAVSRELRFYEEQHQRQTPTWDQVDLHSWFHLTVSMRNDERFWPAWNRLFKPMLLSRQSPSGSWQHNTVFPGGGGEIDSTALAVLMLETYYRGIVLEVETRR